MASAVKKSFPDAQFGVGPVIENGCYYDFVLPRTLVPEDLVTIQASIKELLKRNLVFKVDEVSMEDAISRFEKNGQPLKVELLNDLKTRGTTKLDDESKELFGDNLDVSNIKIWTYWPTPDESIKNWTWKECIEEGKILLNFAYNGRSVGDMRTISNKEELKKILSQNDNDKNHTGLSLDNFYEKSNLGDYVVVLGANKKIIGFAKITGEYLFKEKLDGNDHSRRVDWISTVEIQTDINFSRNTFVEASKNIIEELKLKYSKHFDISVSSDLVPKITIYTITDDSTGEVVFEDLCRGSHVKHVKELRSLGYNLAKFSSAYWRGDQERNISMQRIYALVFETKDELKTFESNREEAKKRDHRVLGEQLDLFAFSELIGKGLPLWLPKGKMIQTLLEKWAEQEEKKQGYSPVASPLITKENLFYTSGHLPHYIDSMYSAMDVDGEKYYIKPMNCPFHHQIFAARTRSYRELPLRFSEYGFCHRYEDSGSLFGLMRVRGMKMNDAHLYCTREQAVDEFVKSIDLIKIYYEELGITDYYLELALRDPESDKYHKDEEMWDIAEKMSIDALEKSGVPFVIEKDGAAFYGPKIDIQIKSSIGKIFTASTSQIDLYMPQRFGLEFTNEKGEKETPVVIHRAPLSTHERFIGYLLEHFAGRFPFWLAPVQIKILTINDAVLPYVDQIKAILDETVLMKPLKYNEIRYEVDNRSETLGKKIREATTEKIPVMIIVGPKDMEAGEVSIRTQEGESKVKLEDLSEFLTGLK